MADKIIKREASFADWYTSLCQTAKLFTYAKTKGDINYLPYGWAIWEKFRNVLDSKMKQLGVSNVQLPLFIRSSDFSKEKKHIEGFAPEAYICETVGGEKLEDPLIIRPTSEVLFSQLFSEVVSNYKDLPLKYNQWCSVWRAEKTTKPFLRGCELVWQELHCLFETQQEAEDFVMKMQEVYDSILKEYCCLAFISGRKTEGEKFAGAQATYTREVLSQDHQFIQTGTNHYLGTSFCKMYDVKYQNKENQYVYPHYTSHGITQRIIGDIIVVHGDDKGLVLPFKLAPIQIYVATLFANKQPQVVEVANRIKSEFSNYEVFVDSSDNAFGFKATESEVKGVPFFLAIGPKDIENNLVTLIRRDTGEKQNVKLDQLKETLEKLSSEYDNNLYNKSLEVLKSNIVVCRTLEQAQDAIKDSKAVIAPWAGSIEDEDTFKEKTGAKPRCLLDKDNFFIVKDKLSSLEPSGEKCIISGKDATCWVFFGRQY